MKAWAIFTTIAISLVWLVSLTRQESEDPGPPPQAAPQPPPPPFNPTEDPHGLSLAELLDKPREELAAMCLDMERQIVAREQLRYEGKLQFVLGPSRYPISFPIWRKATYSAKRGMILPPYLGEDGHDSYLALHLARFGDVEAARKLVDPGDMATLTEINRLALSRNYPAEWTRLVAVYLHDAHYNLAEGSKDGARRIVAFHRQLSALLGDDARKGPLGNTLLSRGRLLLESAMLDWTDREKGPVDRYLELVDASLDEWGITPAPTFPPIHSSKEMAQWLKAESKGLLVSGGDPQRAIDVLGLALPDQAIQGVVGLFAPDGQLQEVLVVYGPDQVEVHVPRHMTYWMDEQLLSTSKSVAEYQVEGWLTRPSENVGPLVRISRQNHSISGESDLWNLEPRLPRDFGVINLDRTFEQNRRLFAWNQGGARLTISDARVLAGLKLPYTGQKITQALLTRDGKINLVGELQLTFAEDAGKAINLIDTARPIWEQAGAAAISVTGDSNQDSVELTWKDAATQICLRVPHHHNSPVTLSARDASGTETSKRLETAQLRDAAERKTRWSEVGKTVARLSRNFDMFELGMSRAELAKRMGRGQTLRREITGGDLYTVTIVSDDDATDWVLRQAVARFDTTGRLVEARLRFCDRPGRKSGTVFGLMDDVRKKSGAPEVVEPGSEAKKAKIWRWLDDTTLLQASADAEGVELIMKDCPLEHPQGRPLAPLYWLPRGPARCYLDTERAALLKQWNIKVPVVSDNAIVLPADPASPYDGVLVWLDGDRVSKIVARHKRGDFLANSAQAGRAVAESWSRQAQVLGWPCQQQATSQGHILSWGNTDECTQVRIFWQQDSDNSLRLFTEWK